MRNYLKDNKGISIIEVLVAIGLTSITLLALAQVADLSSKVDSTSRFRSEVDDFSKVLTSLVLDDQFCAANLKGKKFNFNPLKVNHNFNESLKNINADGTLGDIIFEKNKALSANLTVSDIKYAFEIAKGGGKFIGKLDVTYTTSRKTVGPATIIRPVSFYVKLDNLGNLDSCGESIITSNTSGGLSVYAGDGVTRLGPLIGMGIGGIMYQDLTLKTEMYLFPQSPYGSHYKTNNCTGQAYRIGSTGREDRRFVDDINAFPDPNVVDEMVTLLSWNKFVNGAFVCTPTNTTGNYVKALPGGSQWPCGTKKCIIK